MEEFSVPYTAYEAERARASAEKEKILAHADAATKRANVLCIILIVALILCNIGWIVGVKLFIKDFLENYEIVIDESGEDISADGNSRINYIGRDGDINNGGES